MHGFPDMKKQYECKAAVDLRWFHNYTLYEVLLSVFGSIVYNRAIVYKRQNFLTVFVHVIIIDQIECNQTGR